MSIGNVIVELRSEHGISQKKLADAIGISQSAIAQIEVNRNEATASTIRKLAAFFDVSADYLLGLEDDFGTRPATAPVPMGDNYTADERKIIEQYRSIPDKLKVLVRQQLEIYTAPGELLSKPQKK